MAEIPQIVFTCTAAEHGRKLGDVLREMGFSRRQITRLKRVDGGMLCNSHPIRTVDSVSCGDVISLSEQEQASAEPNGSLAVGILYEDDYLVVFDKPPAMPCHESINHRGDTLSNFFAYHCPAAAFRCVNRLDKDTSGCVVIAKDRYSANRLHKSCKKTYLGIVSGISCGGGRICAPIARESESIIRRCVRSDGQYAATTFCVVKRSGRFALCRFVLETGRTHQIRCHTAYIGHALVGDDMYGEKSELIGRQALHCSSVSFTHPITHQTLTVNAPLPGDMKKLINEQG